MFAKYKHVHFVGIGGVGMSGIAEVLLTLGYDVSGSDLKLGQVTNRLRRRGSHIFRGHRANNVVGSDVVVISSAVKNNNVEYLEAKRLGIPVVRRAEMLAELMRLKYGIAIAGTHGKTSTTSIIATLLYHAGLDPTMVVGGRLNSFRTNARLGRGEFLVAEADESDRSFLNLTPTIAVITNIDPEHMENYRNFAHVKSCYLDFANKVPFYGCVVACADHPEVAKLIQKVEKRSVTYGIENKADFMASDIRQVANRLQFAVSHKGKPLGHLRLNMVGRHNVSNALAAVAVGFELDIPFTKMAEAFAKFKGIERRFQILKKEPLVVTDYAHHPTEIAVTINGARDGWPEKKLLFLHQPHRYTRLKSLFGDFVKVLSRVDKLALLPVYAAGEKALHGIGTRQLYTSLKRRYPKLEVSVLNDKRAVSEWVTKNVNKEDILIFSGAGDIGKLAKEMAKEI